MNMPFKNGYLTTLIQEYTAHCRQQKQYPIPRRKKNYVLVISFTQEEPTPTTTSESIELRLRTTEDISNNESWATMHTTLVPFSYVKHLLNIEMKYYAKKGVTIDTYVVGTPTAPVSDSWKEIWKPGWFGEKKKI